MQTHKSRYWLQTTEEDPQVLQAGLEAVCGTYEQTPAFTSDGTHPISTDGVISIQALEREVIKSMRADDVERVEFEYTRHGTQYLLANFDVVSGQVIAPTVSETRTELDFVTSLQQTVAFAPQDSWGGVLDQLNTHKSESLRIRVVYTPKHSSWLNQVEIWFSILVRRLLKRGNFRSKQHFKERMLGFIQYFNATLAKPFRWTYMGKA